MMVGCHRSCDKQQSAHWQPYLFLRGTQNPLAGCRWPTGHMLCRPDVLREPVMLAFLLFLLQYMQSPDRKYLCHLGPEMLPFLISASWIHFSGFQILSKIAPSTGRLSQSPIILVPFLSCYFIFVLYRACLCIVV